jgi:hypothetical protein
MSALPRATSSVSPSAPALAPKLVRDAGPSAPPPPPPASRLLPCTVSWALQGELAQGGSRLALTCTPGLCTLTLVSPAQHRSWQIPAQIERDDAGLTHLAAQGHAEGLGDVRVLLTLAHTHNRTTLLYVSTNALTLLGIPGGRADVPALAST